MVNKDIMKLPSLFIVFILFAMLFLFVDSGQAEEKEPREYSRNHYFANDELRELIEIRALDNNYDHETTQEMLDRMAAFPRRILQEAVKKDVLFILSDIPAVKLEEFQDLQGELSGKNDVIYDDIAGLARDNVSVAKIGQSYPGDMHYNALLEFHEFAHMVDFNVLDEKVSDMDEFKKIHKKEYAKLFPGSSYYSYADEYFAEAMTHYFLGGWYRETLKDTAPKTFKFMDTFTERILSVDENNDKGIKLSWDAHPKAEKYHIYRDGERIHTTDETTYEDVNFDIFTTHEYAVEIIDEENNVLNKTFSRKVKTEDNTFFSIEDPDNIAVVNNSKDDITLKWENIDNAIYYEVVRDGKLLGSSVVNSYTDKNVKPNKTYEYKVRAVNSAKRFVSFNDITVETDSRMTTFINQIKSIWSNFFIIQILMPIITVTILLLIFRKRK